MAGKKIDTRAVGLDISLKFVEFLTGRENLHYGLWNPDDVVCAAGLGPAQEAYTDKLFKLLPKGRGLRILDIGGGAGETARKLIELGHEVEIVIPSAFLAGRCRENTKGKARVHECRFEDFETDRKFDICLFSESFQYIPLDVSLDKAASLLDAGGQIIIADCFRTEAFFTASGDEAKVGGGHALADFRKAIAARPFKILSEEDITRAVAPSIDLEQAFFNVVGHAVTQVDHALAQSRPLLRGVLGGALRLVLNKRRRSRLDQRLNHKTRNSENFCLYNTYLMIKLAP